jgi:arginine decarboxylase
MTGKTRLKKEELASIYLAIEDGGAIEKVAAVRKWSIEDSENMYQIQGWGEPYFSISSV